eukprot:TRINITY_DN3418_c0_g1_i10.p1 TRINITY_DN3418_c0_g1~~TRINITY_DN3418_c0_g1_i10.p1  ORF type:complete len:517 (+),score=101.39 TRINITY_DN3418_c0_g1_i10:685-2235(+)
MKTIRFVTSLLAIGCVVGQPVIPTCNATGEVEKLMCSDLNIATLWIQELIDDTHNGQFFYDRDQLAAIASFFPSDGVGKGPIPNNKQAELLVSIMTVSEVLLNMTTSISPLQPWQVARVTELKSIHTRFSNLYQRYLKDPSAEMINVIPKWYHGFYSDIASSLEKKEVQPDVQQSGRNFSSIWWDHKPGAFYGPFWVSVDSEVENRNLNYSFYPSVGDGNRSSWYIAFEPEPPVTLFTDQGEVYFSNWIIDGPSQMQNFTTLLRTYLTPVEVDAVLQKTIYSSEARVQDVVIKLARVYSFDRANLITSVTLLPTWGNYTSGLFSGGIGYNWCASKICLGGYQSASNMKVALSSLESGTILQTWGYTNELESSMPKLMLIVKQGEYPIVADVQLDFDTNAERVYPRDYPRHVPLLRTVSDEVNISNSTHIALNTLSLRSVGFHELGISVVQVFGTLSNNTITESVTPDINQFVANGKWEHRLPKFPYQTWSNDCGGDFCGPFCHYQTPFGQCLFRDN